MESELNLRLSGEALSLLEVCCFRGQNRATCLSASVRNSAALSPLSPSQLELTSLSQLQALHVVHAIAQVVF